MCKRWNVLTKSPLLWKKVDVKLILRDNSHTEIVTNFVNTLPFCVTCIRLDFTLISHHFESLKFEEFCVKLQEMCPSLEILILDKAKLSDSLSSIIDLCILFLQNLRILVFRFCIFPDCPARDLCEDISKIEILDVSCCHFGSFIKPPFSRMPDLKTLRLSNTDVDDFWFEGDISFFNQLDILDLGYTRISSRTFRGICAHAFNLKELYLCWANLEDDDFKLNFAVFPHLKTICIRYCRGVEVTYEAVIFLIQSCESLQNIYVTQQVANFFRKRPFVAVNKCNSSGIVKVIDCDGHQKINYLCK